MAARLHFGPDGKLYIGVGENANGANAQTLSNLLGKLLRINSDGTHPNRQSVLQYREREQSRDLGTRAPQSVYLRLSAWHKTALFINDVGQSTWEEIDDGIAGSNYGWPVHGRPDQ